MNGSPAKNGRYACMDGQNVPTLVDALCTLIADGVVTGIYCHRNMCSF